MPNIRGIQCIDDASDVLTIMSGFLNVDDFSVTTAQIEAYLAGHSVEKTEDQVNNWAEAHPALLGCQVRVHIISVSPLKVTCIVADMGVEIPDNWWE